MNSYLFNSISQPLDLLIAGVAQPLVLQVLRSHHLQHQFFCHRPARTCEVWKKKFSASHYTAKTPAWKRLRYLCNSKLLISISFLKTSGFTCDKEQRLWIRLAIMPLSPCASVSACRQAASWCKSDTAQTKTPPARHHFCSSFCHRRAHRPCPPQHPAFDAP